MDLERIQKQTPGTLRQQWYEDGAAVDPGTVTVGITRADGTVLVAAGTATSGSGTAARTFNLTTTHTATLDTLTVTWTSTLKGTLTSYVEVTGGFLFSIAELRAMSTGLANTNNHPTSKLADCRTAVEQYLEDACDVAFVPRYFPDARALDTGDDTANGTGDTLLRLRWPKVRAIRYAAIGGTELGAGEIATIVPNADVGLYYPGYWTAGFGNVTVHYEHGKTMPDEWMRGAGLALAKRTLTSSAVDDRAINVTTDDGTYALFQAAVRGHVVDLPGVQAAINTYNLRAGVA